MGLCNEERYQKALYCLLGMIHELDTREYTTWNDEDDWATTYVDAVRESATQLVGSIIQKLDSTGLYWIMGESDSGLRGLTCEFFQASDGESYWDLLSDTDRGGCDMSMKHFCGRLGFNQHRGMEDIAKWWELWSYIPAVLYPLNRYEDRVFSQEFKAEFNRLIVAVLQLKRRIIAYKDLDQEEKVLLLKYSLFTDASLKLDPDDKEGLDKVIEDLQNMTQEELEKAIRKRYHDKQTRINNYDKPKKATVDPVHGKGVISRDDKIRILMDEFKCDRKFAARALFRAMEHDLDEAREILPILLREHAKENPKTCKWPRCDKKLDYRNKSGFCREHIHRGKKEGIL